MARCSWQDAQHNSRMAQAHHNDISCWLVSLGLSLLNYQKPMFVVPLHLANPMPVRLPRGVKILDTLCRKSQIADRYHESQSSKVIDDVSVRHLKAMAYLIVL